MSYSNRYIIKFYDGLFLVYSYDIDADDSKTAVKIALDNIRGLISFNKIRIINLGAIHCH